MTEFVAIGFVGSKFTYYVGNSALETVKKFIRYAGVEPDYVFTMKELEKANRRAKINFFKVKNSKRL